MIIFLTKMTYTIKGKSPRSCKLTANIWEHKNLQNKMPYFFLQLTQALVILKRKSLNGWLKGIR